MKSLSVCGQILQPGRIIQVPAEKWDTPAQVLETMGLIRRENPGALDTYYVRSLLSAGKRLPAKAPQPAVKTKQSAPKKRSRKKS